MKIKRIPLTASEVDLHKRLFEEQDSARMGSAIRPHELDLLVEIYKAARPARSIEWGLGTGVSAVALGKARQSLGLQGKHLALDPFQGRPEFNDQGLECLAKFSALDSVEFHPITSEEFLIQARTRSEVFDFVFIDGAHDIGQKLMDACLTAQVLSADAIVCFHDSFFVSTSLALIHLVEERGMELNETSAENPIRRRLRGIKHASRLGLKFAFNYAPKIDYALSVLGFRK